MTIHLQLPVKEETLRPTITVVGVGGAGGNAVNNMIASSLEGVNFVVANTDAQALDHSLCERTIQLGAGITKGLGAGANPEVGRAAAEEARDEISAHIEGSNMLFITAGMGGGTGTGAAPVVARLAREQGVLTVAVVTKPFQFEGTHRMRMAEAGLKELQEYVDTLIIIPNQNLFRIANERTTFADAFKLADEVLHSGVRGITDLMVKPGLINLDFADIRTVMREMGKAMMGTGEGAGERRAVEAAEAAISNPLLDDVSLKGARALLINITGGPDLTLFEVDEAANRVREELDPEANIIFGSAFNDGMDGRVRVSVVATGIDAKSDAGNGQKFLAQEPRRPFVHPASVAPRAEGARSSAAPAARAPFVLPQAAALRVEAPRQEEPPPAVTQSPEPPVLSAAQVVEAAAQEALPPSVSPPAQPAMEKPALGQISPRREQSESLREEHAAARGGFFQRMAEVGRALSARQEAESKPQIVVQVSERSAPGAAAPAEKPAKRPGDDQYLDIPAFLRRQAN